MAEKLTPAQQRRLDEIREYQATVAAVRRSVAELDGNRAAKSSVLANITTAIARELSQLRQRALTSGVGTIADTAGALSVLAARTGGLQVKIRGLTEGLASMDIQLEQALKSAHAPAKPS